MKSPTDARFAYQRDPDLYDLIYRLARKRVRDEVFAEDVRQKSYMKAMELVLEGRGPKATFERAWMCHVSRYATYEALRERGEQEPVLATDEEPVLPVPEQQVLDEALTEQERLHAAAEKVAAEHPDKVAEVMATDGRTKQGSKEGAAPKDAATRKLNQRTRELLQAAVIATLAAAVFVLLVRGRIAPRPGLPPGSYDTLANATHDLAHQACAARQWVTCIEDLDQLERLDASKLGAEERGARKAAIAGIRDQALAACTDGDYMKCLEELDTARKYDPDGESDARVQLARSEAQQKLRGSSAPAPSWVPDAKEVPRQHR
jgi:hypothetical protein